MNLRSRFERFCYRNRDKGIPNLMLYIVIGSAIVYLITLINGGYFLYEALRFDKAAILRGQVWRLFTFVFTETPDSNPFLQLIFLYFFYHLSRHTELSLGTFKFNLFYFSGVIIMDIFAMIFCPVSTVEIQGVPVPAELFTYVYADQAFYLHLSLLLLFATTNPDSQFLVFFIIPVKAWFMGIVYLVIIAISIYNQSMLFPHNLFPLVGLLNYLLFVGKDVRNLFPFLRPIPRRKWTAASKRSGTIPFQRRDSGTSAKSNTPYTHRCHVCGRTDTTNPELEFRYCSQCNGYHCYCEEHINNHDHIE